MRLRLDAVSSIPAADDVIDPAEAVYDLPTVADLLGVPVTKVHQQLREGQLIGIRRDGGVVIPKAFFDDSSSWLQAVLERGRREGTLTFSGTAADSATMVMGGLEGAMLLTRMTGDVNGFRAAATRLLAGLTTTAEAVRARA